MGRSGRKPRRLIAAGILLLALAALLPAAAEGQGRRAYAGPTTSSPISLSADERYVWAVNPGDDSVSVVRADRRQVIDKIRVGDEPASVALDPRNDFAYVANAADASVTVIRITRDSTRRQRFRARVVDEITTGSEPWNVIVSPNGQRVFVANSAQDTVSVLTRRGDLIGHVDIGDSRCNEPDRTRHFQPRGMAIPRNNERLFVTGFLAFIRPGGQQGDDDGKVAAVCRLDIDTDSERLRDYRPALRTNLVAQATGFAVDNNGALPPEETQAFPNQLQSIVIRGNSAYLPNIAASPEGPQRFNVSTHAFVSVLDGVRERDQTDAGPSKFINLHLGARQPEPGKKRLFFANPWAIGFTNLRGEGTAYVVSAGSNLLVKVDVGRDGELSNTVDADTTRYIDLQDPAVPETAGDNRGITPQGIAVTRDGDEAWTVNFTSRNLSVVDLEEDRVVDTVRLVPLPTSPQAQTVVVGAENFFSSRGEYDRPPGARETLSTTDRLSSEGWQSCASCHFEGLTDGVIWEFPSGPRKSVPLNATFNPQNRSQQRILNYSAIFNEVHDFAININNVSGPGPLAAPIDCSAPPPAQSTIDPQHGLILGDVDPNLPPCVINAFAKSNEGRNEITQTLPGSANRIRALSALNEWVRVAVRSPDAPLRERSDRPGLDRDDVRRGRALFERAGCTDCHVGGLWSTSVRRDTGVPGPEDDLRTERDPAPVFGNPAGVQFLNAFLRDVGSFDRGVPGQNNDIGRNVGADEKATAVVVGGISGAAPDGLGIDYNNDGKGIGFSPPSLLSLLTLPPYYHNGACETLECVVGDVKHRTANGTRPDGLPSGRDRRRVAEFLKSIDAQTEPF